MRLWGLSMGYSLKTSEDRTKSAVRSLDDCNARNLEAAKVKRVWSWPWAM